MNKIITNNPYVDRKMILDTFCSGAVAMQALINPVAAISMAVAVEIIKYVANTCLDNYEKGNEENKSIESIYESLRKCESISELSYPERDKLIDRAFRIISDLDKNDFEKMEHGNTRALDSKIMEVVKSKGLQTSAENEKRIRDIIVFGINMASLFEAKELISFILNENDARKKEIDEFNNRLSKVENNVEEIKNRPIPSAEHSEVRYTYSTDNIRTEIEYYKDNFTKPLYLHKDNKDVTLKNLFVIPKVKKNESKVSKNLRDFLIDDFNNMDSPLVMIGDGGSGKTSVVSWLTYLYYGNSGDSEDDRYKKEDREAIFGDRELIIIRLRFLDVHKIESNGIFESICDYIGIHPDKRDFFTNKYIVLDGFDELYLSELVKDWNSKFEALLGKSIKNAKLIITSRPGIIEVNENESDNNRIEYIYINPYERKEKENWLGYYKKYTREIIDCKVEEFILSDDEESVFVYPQLLYMVAGQKENSNWRIDNKWSLYHHIFYDELSGKPYTQDYDYLEEKKDDIYALTELIAYDLYKKRFVKEFDNTDNQVHTLIDELQKNTPRKISDDLVERCFSLCCFYNNDISERNKIEFLHNNIRDFFIAEYLYRKLNEIFKDVVTNKDFESCSKEEIAKKLFGLFQGVAILKEAAEFMALRARFNRDSESPDVLSQFLTNNIPVANLREENGKMPIHDLLNVCSTNLNVYSEDISKNDRSIATKIANFLNDLISVFTVIINYIVDIKKHEFIRMISPYRFESNYVLEVAYGNRNVDRYINLNHVYLEYTNMQGLNLRGANMEETYLEGASFDGANLIAARLNGADMRSTSIGFATMIITDLSGANLQESLMTKTDLFHAKLENANLKGAGLDRVSLFGADLYNADLSKTSLCGAEFYLKDIKRATHYEEAIYSKKKELNDKIIESIKDEDEDMYIELLEKEYKRTLQSDMREVM